MSRIQPFQLAVVFVSLLAFTGCPANTGAIPKDLQYGDEIVAALEKYHADHGHYPDTLWALQPEYIREIKQPRYGERRWDYTRYCEKGTFALVIWGAKPYHDGYGYNVPDPKWTRIENSF